MSVVDMGSGKLVQISLCLDSDSSIIETSDNISFNNCRCI